MRVGFHKQIHVKVAFPARIRKEIAKNGHSEATFRKLMEKSSHTFYNQCKLILFKTGLV